MYPVRLLDRPYDSVKLIVIWVVSTSPMTRNFWQVIAALRGTLHEPLR